MDGSNDHEMYRVMMFEGDAGTRIASSPFQGRGLECPGRVLSIRSWHSRQRTAVGMVDQVAVMIAAVIVSVGLVMLFAAGIGRFVSNHPTVKMLKLSFLTVVGVALVAEGFGHKVPKGY